MTHLGRPRMSHKTFGTMFTGGALFDTGAVMAGLEPIWGIEKENKIADIARLNSFPVQTGDVIATDFSKLHRPDHLHASPPCPNFSTAKTNAVETDLDIAMAQSICRALVEFKPETFTLEQVVGYRNSKSFKLIARCLSDLGYWWDATNLNAADFGVPQTRNRLWIRAKRGLLMGYPPPEKWQGWYEAIEDLIPTLPDTEFAPWQVARLPEEYKTFMLGQGTYSPVLDQSDPAQTITANSNQSGVKAFVIGSGNEPHTTVIASMDRTPSRAYVGRVVKMTVQALGRFQTVPDSYKGLTIRINGNGCPPKEVKNILETLL